ncbi:serine incorporator [Pyrus ussuriensis x Pyrus communis]|uniref:Serine incorporator n=1 Tax=Pyrus ussuriensis x Pyrus communis TaxID=2448454 RepID=A0A5N5GSH8_9ROSA|nr:serine incorporator [Pyrus ussuriensis x Pyrus communis]
MEEGGSAGNYQWSGLKVKVDSWFSQFRNGSNPWMARYAYGFMFLIANLMAWAVRDYGSSVLTEMERLKGCHGVKDCLGAEGVLRVSLGCFLFYFTMFLSTIGTSKLNEPRDLWQSGWWSAKIVMWVSFIIIPFVLPAKIIQLYGEIAHFGAGVFLLIQLISIISFIKWLNDWCQSTKSERWFSLQPDLCDITCNYCTCCMLSGDRIDVHMVCTRTNLPPQHFLHYLDISTTATHDQCLSPPECECRHLDPGLMGLYIVFICWFAIRSEPAGTSCNKKAEDSTKTDWLTIISFVIAVLAMVIATFSTGIDSKCFKFRNDETESEDDVPYGYGFFHFVFATGAMYFAMLLIGWNTHQSMKKFTLDVGWASTWVRIVNEWIAVCVYLWMLVAPIIWKSRQTAESA